MYSRNQHPKQLRDFSFFPLKEMLGEVISSAAEQNDFKSAFFCVFCFQNVRLMDEKGAGDKHMREFFYSLTALRTQNFWFHAVAVYKSVGWYFDRRLSAHRCASQTLIFS